jgi:hypothetical protein
MLPSARVNAHLKRQLLPERPCRAMSTHAATCQLQELRSGIWPSAVRCAGAHLDFFGHDRPLLRSIDQHQFLELLVLLHREDGRQARLPLWGVPSSLWPCRNHKERASKSLPQTELTPAASWAVTSPCKLLLSRLSHKQWPPAAVQDQFLPLESKRPS